MMAFIPTSNTLTDVLTSLASPLASHLQPKESVLDMDSHHVPLELRGADVIPITHALMTNPSSF
jgi:hypothetical protein